MRPITGPFGALLFRCAERGYTLREIEPCILHRDGEMVTVDVDHPAYPREAKSGFSPPHAKPPRGPGTELKKLLAGWPFHLVASADCKCNQRARYMDAKGCDWVEANIEECVGYLRESAAERGLPFVDMAGRVLVRRAIANARKEEARRAQEAQQAQGGPPAV